MNWQILSLLTQLFGQAVGSAAHELVRTAHAGLVFANSQVRAGSAQAPVILPLPPTVAGAVALTCAAAAAALSQLLANASDLSSFQRVTFMHASSELRTAAALMASAFRQQKHYDVFDPLYGSSMGSALTDGRPFSPWRNSNPFANIVPIVAPHVTQTVDAIHAARTLTRTDVVVDPPLLPATVAAYAQAVAAGTSFE